MTELTRAELYALWQITRTAGWSVVERVLAKLVQDRIDVALELGGDTAAKTHRAGGAKEIVTEFHKFTASLVLDQISETASD